MAEVGGEGGIPTREKGDYIPEDVSLETMFPGRFKKKLIVCQTQPLRMCIHENKSEMSCQMSYSVP